MRILTVVASLSIFIVGCQSGPIKEATVWHSTITKDEFTDQVTKMVTMGEWASSKVIVTQSLKFYPFVGTQDGTLFVGIRSGGRFRIPTGTVQIRVDDNPAWTIAPDETPISMLPKSPTIPIKIIPDSNGIANKTINSTQEATMQMISRMSSPYTAATGQKARDIINQMLKGKVIKYRIIGVNQPASSTGEVRIDDSFTKSLVEIGLSPASLN